MKEEAFVILKMILAPVLTCCKVANACLCVCTHPAPPCRFVDRFAFDIERTCRIIIVFLLLLSHFCLLWLKKPTLLELSNDSRGMARTSAQATADFKTNLNDQMRQPVAKKDDAHATDQCARSGRLGSDETVALSGFKAQNAHREASVSSEATMEVMNNTGVQVQQSRRENSHSHASLPGQASFEQPDRNDADGR